MDVKGHKKSFRKDWDSKIMGAPTKLGAEVRKFHITFNRELQIPALKLYSRKMHSATQILYCRCSFNPVVAKYRKKVRQSNYPWL